MREAYSLSDRRRLQVTGGHAMSGVESRGIGVSQKKICASWRRKDVSTTQVVECPGKSFISMRCQALLREQFGQTSNLFKHRTHNSVLITQPKNPKPCSNAFSLFVVSLASLSPFSFAVP